jgi:hypothetical protein
MSLKTLMHFNSYIVFSRLAFRLILAQNFRKMRKSFIAGVCALLLMSSCHHKVLKPLPPGQAKKSTAPGQIKKSTGSKSAAPYAPGQQKKKTAAGKSGKKN